MALTEAALDAYARLTRAVLDSVEDVVLAVDAEGRIVLCSGRVEELLATGRDELELSRVEDALAGLGERAVLAVAELLAEGSGEVVLELAGDRALACRVLPLGETQDQPLGYRAIVLRDMTGERRELEQSRRMALHDPLTGLPNRELLIDRLGHALSRIARETESVAVMFLDLDGFKAVNDTYGHATGDRVLIEVARRLQAEVRRSDTVTRLGGDEFVLLCEGISDPELLGAICGRIASSVEEPYAVGETVVSVAASIGAVIARDDSAGPDELLERADAMMYSAKRRRSQYEVESPASQPPAGGPAAATR